MKNLFMILALLCSCVELQTVKDRYDAVCAPDSGVAPETCREAREALERELRERSK